jgi:hypothetical protein
MLIDTIALDLEGTLISNAVRQFPRPGLFDFLEFCAASCRQVVLFTAVPEEPARRILDLLVEEKAAPPWFRSVPYVEWDLHFKDLCNIPSSDALRSLIVDDNPDYILPEQRSRWIPIEKYQSPYTDDDEGLDRARCSIQAMIER